MISIVMQIVKVKDAFIKKYFPYKKNCVILATRRV